MSGSTRMQLSIARWLVRAAAWLLRTQQPEWAQAMSAELEHVAGQERIKWARGCLAAAVHARVNPMNAGNFRVARWVVLVETLGLFGPATLAWFEFARVLVRLDSATVSTVFLGSADGRYILSTWIVAVIAGLIGPIGLFLGLRCALSGRALRNRAIGFTLLAVPVVAFIATTIAALVLRPTEPPHNLALVILLWVLPFVGIAHLMYLGRPFTDARLAAA